MTLPSTRAPIANETVRRLRRYLWIAAGAWTAVTLTSLALNHNNERRWLRDTALIQANIALDKDIQYRLWNAGHGGVYVPVSAHTPPNPYLSHVPTRDLTTTQGTRLTLVNPAYMTRQVHSLRSPWREVRGHLTSLRTVNPDNAPDDWERAALTRFEQGGKEVSGYGTLGGKPYFRLMRPFRVQKDCLRCHQVHGFREGEIRGGLSVSVPMDPLRALAGKRVTMAFLVHLGALLLGLLGITLGGRRLLGAERARMAAAEERSRATEIDLVISKLASALGEDRDLGSMAELARRAAMAVTRSPVGLVGQREPTTGTLVWSAGPDDAAIAGAASDSESAAEALGRCGVESLSSRKGVLVNDLPGPSRTTAGADARGALRRYIALPVLVDGEPPWILALANADDEYTERDRDALGRIASLYTLAIQRQRANVAKAIEHDNLRVLFEASPLAIVEIDLGGVVKVWNPAAERLFGWRAAEVLGKEIPIVPEDHRDELAGILALAQRDGESVTGFETVRLHRDGHLLQVSLSLAIRKNPDGHVEGLVGIIEEITERKRLEAEREALIAQLRDAMNQVRTLSGIIPICMHCKKIRDDTGYWTLLESFIQEHTETEGFSHGICPECLAKHYPDVG